MSLEDISFDQVLESLRSGECLVDQVALLPTDFRFRLLKECPPTVVHRLESTQFTVGIDMKLIWHTMYEQYVKTFKPKFVFNDRSEMDTELDGIIDDEIATVLTTYSGVKKLRLTARGAVQVDLEKFIAITKHQSSLEWISINTCEDKQYKGCGACARHSGRKPIAIHSPQFSLPLLDSWFQMCLTKSTVRRITLNLAPITARFLVQSVIDFLSSPCSQEQILHFYCMSLGEKEDNDTTPWYRKPSAERKLFKCVEVDMSELTLKPFDSQHTLHYKSLEVSGNCRFTSTFISFFSKLPPFKLKKLSYKTTWLRHNPERDAFFINLFEQRHFDMQALELAWIDLGDATINHYDALLQKESLQTVILDQCRGVDKSLLFNAASRHGFTFSEVTHEMYGIGSTCTISLTRTL